MTVATRIYQGLDKHVIYRVYFYPNNLKNKIGSFGDRVIIKVSMTMKCLNHRSQTNPWHREEGSPELRKIDTHKVELSSEHATITKHRPTHVILFFVTFKGVQTPYPLPLSLNTQN